MGNGCAYWRDVHTGVIPPTLLCPLFYFPANDRNKRDKFLTELSV